MSAHIVALRHALEIIEQGLAIRKVRGPLVIGLKDVVVEMVGGVHLATRIGVFVPGPADFRVLIHQQVIDSSLLQAYGGKNSRHARSNDQHSIAGGYARIIDRYPAAILVQQVKLLAHQFKLFFREGYSGNVLHGLGNHGVIGCGQCRATGVAVSDDRGQRQLSRLISGAFAQSVFLFGQLRNVWPYVPAQRITGTLQVHQRGHQRWHMGQAQSLFQLCVADLIDSQCPVHEVCSVMIITLTMSIERLQAGTYRSGALNQKRRGGYEASHKMERGDTAAVCTITRDRCLDVVTPTAGARCSTGSTLGAAGLQACQ